MIKEVAFVAVAVSDFKRSRKFYEETLELKPDSASGDFPWAEYTLGGTTIGVGQHPNWQPSRDGTTIPVAVDDNAHTTAPLKKRWSEFDQ